MRNKFLGFLWVKSKSLPCFMGRKWSTLVSSKDLWEEKYYSVL